MYCCLSNGTTYSLRNERLVDFTSYDVKCDDLSQPWKYKLLEYTPLYKRSKNVWYTIDDISFMLFHSNWRTNCILFLLYFCCTFTTACAPVALLLHDLFHWLLFDRRLTYRCRRDSKHYLSYKIKKVSEPKTTQWFMKERKDRYDNINKKTSFSWSLYISFTMRSASSRD